MQTPPQMQAMAIDEFVGLDRLTLHTLPLPEVGADEVLIRVCVAGVGVWDAREREGTLIYNEEAVSSVAELFCRSAKAR